MHFSQLTSHLPGLVKNLYLLRIHSIQLTLRLYIPPKSCIRKMRKQFNSLKEYITFMILILKSTCISIIFSYLLPFGTCKSTEWALLAKLWSILLFLCIALFRKSPCTFTHPPATFFFLVSFLFSPVVSSTSPLLIRWHVRNCSS